MLSIAVISLNLKWIYLHNFGAVKLMRTRIRLLAQPKPMRSIIDVTQREQRQRGSARNGSCCRDGVPGRNGCIQRRGQRRILANFAYSRIEPSRVPVVEMAGENSQLCCLPSDLFLAGQHFL
jgi:hypothetical protein